MIAPLPQELEDVLKELKDCGNLVDDRHYTPEQRLLLHKLQAVGLVELSWRLTPSGETRMNAPK